MLIKNELKGHTHRVVSARILWTGTDNRRTESKDIRLGSEEIDFSACNLDIFHKSAMDI